MIGNERGSGRGKTIGNTADNIIGGEDKEEGEGEDDDEEGDGDESGVSVWDIECTDLNRPCFSSTIDTCTDTSPSEQLTQGDEEGEVEVGGGVVSVKVEEEHGKGKGNNNAHTLPLPLLRHLPNWWFSLSLSTFIEEKAKDKYKDKRMSNLDGNSNTSASSSSMGMTSEHILMKVRHYAVLVSR
jgi:hypothetical protein